MAGDQEETRRSDTFEPGGEPGNEPEGRQDGREAGQDGHEAPAADEGAAEDASVTEPATEPAREPGPDEARAGPQETQQPGHGERQPGEDRARGRDVGVNFAGLVPADRILAIFADGGNQAFRPEALVCIRRAGSDTDASLKACDLWLGDLVNGRDGREVRGILDPHGLIKG